MGRGEKRLGVRTEGGQGGSGNGERLGVGVGLVCFGVTQVLLVIESLIFVSRKAKTFSP